MMSAGKPESFVKSLEEKAGLVSEAISSALTAQSIRQERLAQAMRYTLEAPGKRLRGALVLWCAEVTGGREETDAITSAVAVEMVHCYSLVHDDLPAMDDDDLRRGRPTCHIAFDEATAILTGDALLTLAFELLARRVQDAGRAVRLIAELAEAAGPAGMIAGQMADLEGEGIEGSVPVLQRIHTDKTAKMFRAACRMGAICGGGSEVAVEALGGYGLKLGLGFQIRDDILDVSATSDDLGKTAGKDAQQGKMTYPAVIGMEQSQIVLNKLADEAVSELAGFGAEADCLRALAVALKERKK